MESSSTTSSPVALKTIKKLDAQGYDHSFIIEGEGFRCLKTKQFFNPSQLKIVDSYRDEGISDPDDMSIIYVVETDSGMKGTIQDAFGVYASPKLGELIGQMRDERQESKHTSVA